MKRRSFMRAVAAAAAVELLPSVTAALGDELQALRGDADWRRVQGMFLLDDDLVHLNAGSLGATPRLVIDAMAGALRELEGNPVKQMWGDLGAQVEVVRQRAADFIGADLDETALTRNTTEGMNAIAEGIDFKPGDEVLTTNHEHGGGMSCWQHVAETKGAKVVCVHLPQVIESAAQLVSLIAEKLTDRTKVCSLSHVDTITGMVMPLADVAKVTRPRGVLLVADGAQGPGMIDVDVKALGVDAYAASAHKWLLGPKGSGLLYIAKVAQDRIKPAMLRGGFRAYSGSSGTRDVAQLLGLGVTMDFHEAIGRERVVARCRALGAQVSERLGRIAKLREITPRDDALRGAMMTFAVEGMPSGEVYQRLYDEHHILVKPAQGTYVYVPKPAGARENYNAIRISPHVYNDEAQVAKLGDALEKMLG